VDRRVLQANADDSGRDSCGEVRWVLRAHRTPSPNTPVTLLLMPSSRSQIVIMRLAGASFDTRAGQGRGREQLPQRCRLATPLSDSVREGSSVMKRPPTKAFHVYERQCALQSRKKVWISAREASPATRMGCSVSASEFTMRRCPRHTCLKGPLQEIRLATRAPGRRPRQGP